MFLVDTHCHLNLNHFEKNVEEVINRAHDVGVDRIVVPGVNLISSERAVKLATTHEGIFAAIGIHPGEVNNYQPGQRKELEGLIKENKVVAIGEIGLDLYHRSDNLDDQIYLLNEMLSFADEFQKPVILHSRNSLDEIILVIQKWISKKPINNNSIKGVFHSFEGNSNQGDYLRSINFMLGVAGPITYKNAIIKQNLVREIGAEHIVLETDSPYLSPHPYRGQTNEPSRISVIAEKVSEILGNSFEEIARHTTRNAYSLFRWEF